ncbi:MAG: SPASM domain-containing protein [Methanobrevibacter sp.]|jgi:radical SAM protein with 4Fe4S-binding SPASM domain|nr:SPASM domain-containing protein [Candidatus Methanovirga procula]
MPQGRGEGFYNELLKDKQFHFDEGSIPSLVEVLSQAKKKFGDFIFQLPNIHDNCGAGTRNLTIMPNGDIKLCPMANDSVIIGNIYNNSLKDIFSKNLANVFMSIEEPNPKICDNCTYLYFCGGCLARGIIKYQEIGEKCIWGLKVNLDTKLFKTKKIASVEKHGVSL